MLCPTWRKNSGRNSTSHGSGLPIPTTLANALKEENRSPSSIEDIIGGGGYVNVGGVKPQAPPERGGTTTSPTNCRGSCEVTLRRKSGDTLGLGIAGGSDKGCPPTVSCLRPGGIAHRSDCLQVGDLLTGVNGHSVQSLQHEDILTVLRNAGEQVILSVEYDLNHPCFDRPPPHSTVTKTCLVRLGKEGGGLGLTIRGGAYGPDASKSRSLTVTAIRAGGPAHRDGRIRMGDRITAINGSDVTTATLRSALAHLERSNECVLTLDYDVSVLDAVNHAQGPLLLEIDKPAGEELGVTLNVEEVTDSSATCGGGHEEKSATVKRYYVIGAIGSASIADRCGALFNGDQLLAIDGITLEYTTLAEVYQLLKGSSNSQNIRVEIVPRYLRALYSQQQDHQHRSNQQQQQQSTRLHRGETPADYAIIASAHRRSKKEKSTSGGTAVRATQDTTPTSAAAALPPKGMSKSVSMNGGGGSNTNGGGHQSHSFQDSLLLATSPPPSSSNYHARMHNGNNHRENNKKSPDKETRQSTTVAVAQSTNGNGGNGRSRKLTKQQQQFSVPQLVSSGSEKCKKGNDRRQSSSTSKNGRGRSSSAVGSRFGTPVHDLMPLSSGSLTASVSAVPCGQVCHSEVMEVVLNCWARGGYGMILHRNQSMGDQQQQSRSPLFVSYIERGSPADKSGVLLVGDRILAINDWCTSNGTPEEANHIIRHATGPLTLTIEFDVIETVLPSSGCFTVKLAKRGQNLGIVFQATSSSQKGDPVVVSDVRTGSVAHRCGTIHAGDQILAIDNIPLDTCTVDEASRLLHRSSDIVKLRIKKNLGAIVDEFDSAGGSSGVGPQTVVYTVELSRKNGPLGLTIAGTDDRYDPIFVSQLAPGGLAEKTGAVRVGDRIIAINGQSLQTKRVSEALQYLHQAGDSVSLKIARCVAPPVSSTAVTTPTGPLSVVSHHSGPSIYHHHPHHPNVSTGSSYLPQLVTLSTGILDRQNAFHEHYNERETTDKLGTPVQSIDSAVESLEDSPLNDSQHPSTGSNRTSQNSKSSSLSGVGGHSSDACVCAEDLSTQLHRTLSAMKTGCSTASQQSDAGSSNAATDDDSHYAQLGGVECPCQNHQHTSSSANNSSQDEWIRVLEALETVGEAEMLKKLEESILSGTVPSCSDMAPPSCSQNHQTPPKPPPKPSLAPPFPITNTILRHPYSNTSRATTNTTTAAPPVTYAQINRHEMRSINSHAKDVSISSASSILTPMNMSVSSSSFAASPSSSSSTFTTAPPCPTSRPLSISTIFSGYEHIPFITTPVPNVAMVASAINPRSNVLSTVAPSSNVSSRVERSNSPASSSIQLSGSATPSAETAAAAMIVVEQSIMRPPTSSSSGATSGGGPYASNSGAPRVPLEIYRISLMKDKLYNDFGFSVSDGMQDKGVYINKIRAGGPADLLNNVKPFDRILQVNGTSLQDLDCMLAVPLLAAAGDRIDLLICRDPLLAASCCRATESIEEEDEEETGSMLGQTTV